MKLLTALACILITGVFCLAVSSVFGPLMLTETFCTQADQSCIRDWVSAFSGWAAAALALAAALLALPPLRMQVAEARKQSAFLLGDADASIDLHASLAGLDGGLVDVRITNWNRRSMEVREIKISVTEPGDFVARICTIDLGGIPFRAGEVHHADASRILKFKTPIYVKGWENRSEAPCALIIDVDVIFAGSIYLPASREITVEVGYDRLADVSKQTLHATRRIELTEREARRR